VKILLSAYACEPDKGSEPGVGWNVARALARSHEVWVLTRANNRAAIERELARAPMPGLHGVYYDLPPWARWWKWRQRGVHLYYYLWQMGAVIAARRLHREVRFDLVHHVTFAKYWTPSLVSLLGVPFLWGPVGGGESIPFTFRRDIGPRGVLVEALRDLGRWLGEHDPLVRLTARRSAIALASTPDTARRLRMLPIRRVHILSQLGLPTEELDALACQPLPADDPVRFLSIGSLCWWKGFHLGLQAFAKADVLHAEYWIVGDGPERARLQRLAAALGVAPRVRFWGALARADVLRKLAESHVLVFPGLRESGGAACLEAMAAGRPVICLSLGGLAVQVTEDVGFAVPAHDPDQSVRDMAEAMRHLAYDEHLRQRMGGAGKDRCRERYCSEDKAVLFDRVYRDVVGETGTFGFVDGVINST